MLTTIPFSGFYYTRHDQELDWTIENMFGSRDSGERNPSLELRCWEACKWGQVHEAYAKAYCENFAAEFGIKLEFESMQSPREYNFTTDRIFAHIELDEVKRLRSVTDEKLLRDLARKRFTSYDGFISHYSSDIDDWGDIQEWDYNQVGTLVMAYANQEHGEKFDMSAEFDLMECDRGNCEIENWIAEATPGIERLFKVWTYLNDRMERRA